MEQTRTNWLYHREDAGAAADAEAITERFAEEVQAYKHNLFRVAMSILKNYADAEDAVGECILQAFIHRSSLRSFDRLKPWIMKILVRECYRIQKKRQRIEYHDDIQPFDQGKNDEYRELWDIIDKLPERYRIVVTLFYYENLDTADIAGILKIPVGTVKSRLARARAKMKQELSDEGGNYDD